MIYTFKIVFFLLIFQAATSLNAQSDLADRVVIDSIRNNKPWVAVLCFSGMVLSEEYSAEQINRQIAMAYALQGPLLTAADVMHAYHNLELESKIFSMSMKDVGSSTATGTCQILRSLIESEDELMQRIGQIYESIELNRN